MNVLSSLCVLSAILTVGSTGLALDAAVVGIKECDVFCSEELSEKIVTLEAGTEVSVVKYTNTVVQLTTPKGEQGWVRRCALCLPDEYVRRKKASEIPDRVFCVGAETNGSTFLYGGSLSIKNGRYCVESGQGVWLDESAKGREFHIAAHNIQGDPKVMFLYKPGADLAILSVWPTAPNRAEAPSAAASAPAGKPVREPAQTESARGVVPALAYVGDTVVVRTCQGVMIGTVVSGTTSNICFQGAGKKFDTAMMTNLVSYKVIARTKTESAEHVPPEGKKAVEEDRVPHNCLQGAGKIGDSATMTNSVGRKGITWDTTNSTERIGSEETKAARKELIQRQNRSLSDLIDKSPAVQKARQRAVQNTENMRNYYKAAAKLRSEGYEVMDNMTVGGAFLRISFKSRGGLFQQMSVAEILKWPSSDAGAAGSKYQREIVSAESTVVLVNKSNPYSLKVTLVNGSAGKVVYVPADSRTSTKTEPGHYELFMISSAEPEAEYQGDSFSVTKGSSVMITFKAPLGNYNLKRVK